jgi:hypothetical protein
MCMQNRKINNYYTRITIPKPATSYITRSLKLIVFKNKFKNDCNLTIPLLKLVHCNRSKILTIFVPSYFSYVHL